VLWHACERVDGTWRHGLGDPFRYRIFGCRHNGGLPGNGPAAQLLRKCARLKNALTSQESAQLSEEVIRRQIQELGEWFQNIDLAGIPTAPNHFLGDYPAIKWRKFAHAIPLDLRGKSVLDIGCNAGFYSLEMKRRGAGRVVGIDVDIRYLAQARLAAK